MAQNQDKAGLQRLDEAALDRVSGGAGAGVTQGFGSLPEGGYEALIGQQAPGLDSALQQQLQEMRDRNDLLRDFNTVLGVLRGDAPGAEGFGQFTDHAGQQQDVAAWLQQHDITLDGDGNGSLSQSEVSQTVQAIKDTMDGMQQMSQHDMLKLQQQMNSFGQATELMNQTMQTIQQSLQSVIQKVS
ncbi:hypothetical protein [Pseudoroseomonas cervicalis]|uniref:hypothetical protein n=1 Tax=Teichococcus cervicalis TaxID=204525 RepID=UPI00277DD0EB|nr:hypothetical protein [Pseudoroseomonas cervicalis]MDQ1077485.1 hypothetical protein [Pseudoroseomonas cervicalis]